MSREESANSHNSPPKKTENEENINNKDNEIPAKYKEEIQKMIKEAMKDFSTSQSQPKSNKRSRSKSVPSRKEETYDSSAANNKPRDKKRKKLKIGGCSFKDFKYYGPKEFHGDKGAITTVRWLEEMETIVITSKCTDEEKIQYSALMFKGEAHEWWNALWETFKGLILKKFCPTHEMDRIQTELWNHKVVGTNLREYNTKFLEYFRLVPHLVTPEYNKVTRYISGLPREIRDMVRSHMPETVDSAMELAEYLINSMIRNQEEEKIKDKETKKPKDSGKIGKEESTPKSAFKTCGRKHTGKCRLENSNNCAYCKRAGHTIDECRKKLGVCFTCGETGQFKTECPKRKANQD
ncbi:uncharacterized protein LOC143551806 [Bidens hawaiensis]|uniref:uncharacterized protein LOC143551806 n=1 Tax=Bidens hawaiensis TaxID=980011 RepID=UPI00404B6C40